MFVSVVLNTEYMDYASRKTWYLKNLLHCKDNGWILITHDYIRKHFDELQDAILGRIFEQMEMRRFTLDEVKDVEQYFIPDELFDEIEKATESHTTTLLNLNNKGDGKLYETLSEIFNQIREKHPNEKVEGILHCLEPFESIKAISKELNVPLIKYSFSAIRKTMGYQQTLYQVNIKENYWNTTEAKERWEQYKQDNQSRIPVFSNEEIISIIGKEHTLPLIQLISSRPQYEVGICCECYSLTPQTFAQDPYVDDDIFYECNQLYPKDKIKVRSHAIHLNTIQVDRSEVHNDPASTILSCKRTTAVQSQIVLKALLWKRTAVMKKPFIAFSFLCDNDYSSLKNVDIEALNYFIFCYLIPSELMFSDEYWKWRLTNPSETEIYQRHLNFLFDELNIDKKKVMQLKGKERYRYLLESRNCDEQLINNLLSDEVVDNINWDVASSRFDIVSELEIKSYWRIDTTNEDNDLTTNLAVDVKNAKIIMFYPLDDVAGFARLKTVYINGRQQILDEATTSFKYMPKTKGAYSFKLDNPYSGILLVECIWEYKKVFEFLNNN